VNTKVKVVYGFGYGTAPLGQASPVNDKILAMTGESTTTIHQPTVFVFEPSIRNKTDIIAFKPRSCRCCFSPASGPCVDSRKEPESEYHAVCQFEIFTTLPTWIVPALAVQCKVKKGNYKKRKNTMWGSQVSGFLYLFRAF